MMITKFKQLASSDKLLAAIGSIASIVGLIIYFFPSPAPSPVNSQKGDAGNIQIINESGMVVVSKGEKQDTSDDPRKELQNMGVTWNGKNFLDAIKVGDERVVTLFLKGGMHPESAESDGRSLAIMLALNESNPERMLDLLLKNDLDINHQFKQYAVLGEIKTTLLGSAIERGNNKLVSALVSNNAETNKPLQTYGAMGIATEKFPLQSAIYWKHSEIAILLINANTDISVGDYAAYRQAYSMKNDYYWKEHPSELNQILQLTAPPADKAKRINNELRIEEINIELNEIAKKSFQSYSSPHQKNQYDQRYDKLQEEKKILESALKAKL